MVASPPNMVVALFLHPKSLEDEYVRLYLSQAPLVYKCRIAGTDTTLQALVGA
jgi:hypothetical protein